MMRTFTLVILTLLSFGTEAQIKLDDNIQMSAKFRTKFVNDSLFERKYYSQETNNAMIIDFPNIEAEFVGGHNRMIGFIENNFGSSKRKLSKYIKKYGAFTISYRFIIDSESKLKDLEMINGAYPKLDDEISRIVMLGKWMAGESSGKKANTICTLEITLEQTR